MGCLKLHILLGLVLELQFGSGFLSTFFKQPNLHLGFNSFYVDENKFKMYSLEANELVPILDFVSSKFTKIYTQTIYSQSGLKKHEQNQIPEAVALLNKQYQRNKIELFMTIHWNSINGSVEVGNALQAANKANSLFPGSVTHLLVTYVEFNRKKREQVDLHYPYKIGVIISADRCAIGDFFILIKNVQLLILDFGDRELVDDEEVEESFAKMKKEFELCREKVKGNFAFINADVGLQVNWLSSSGNSSDLIEFWVRVNNWSIQDNVKVFMKNAFDEIPANRSSYEIGRWKVVSRDRAKIQFEDKFGADEEGIEVIENLNSSTDKKKENQDDQYTIIIFPVVGTVFIIGIVLLVLYRRKRIKKCLTRKEINTFYKGTESFSKDPNKETDCISSIERKGYNKEFEVDKANFKLSDCLLGSGAFGEVWKGTVNKAGIEFEVAAKALKRGCRTSALKGFLSEIKVMGYLGKHKNLVEMVGAYTKGLERGKVIIFTELCGKGSLESYLRNLGKSSIGNKDGAVEIDLTCFHRWCLEIANGMEYLSLKNVVHADLATRNVLLNDKLTAKISDFGLSRRLYDYTIYVKKKRQQEEPLPWKWMSPESLQRLEFNEKTDVWAFGVTMWEIYSLGNTPYPGLNWTADFPTKLVKGLRMEKPLYDDGGMYILMIKCWNDDPSKRPTFSELITAIQTTELKPVHDYQSKINEESNDDNQADQNYLEI